MDRRAIVRPGLAQRGSLRARRCDHWQPQKKAPRRRNLQPGPAGIRICRKGGNNDDRLRQRKLSHCREIDFSEVATCRQFCRHLNASLTGRGDKSGYMSPVLSPLHDASKSRFEGLRLGSGERQLDRAENFHADIPSPWIDSGVRAPIPEWHLPGRHESPGTIEEHAPTTHQPRNKGASTAQHDAATRITAILSRQG